MSNVNLPVTRYYGSKRKLGTKIWESLKANNIEFDSILDMFGGSASFSYLSKLKGKSVIYNDLFKFNYYIGKALIEENYTELNEEDIEFLLRKIPGHNYKQIIEKYFQGIYYTEIENKQIDIIVQNIHLLGSPNKVAGAFYILFQACLIKRPFNLFHRNNLNLRVNFNGGNFGNKVTWERSFEELFKRFFIELKQFTFDNQKQNRAINCNALTCKETADLIYIDPPYFQVKNHVPYHSMYHFLEGLANYSLIEENINFNTKHREISINKSKEFESKSKFLIDLNDLLSLHPTSKFAISYRGNGIPSVKEIEVLVGKFRKHVHSVCLGNYGYALNKSNGENFEYLIIGC